MMKLLMGTHAEVREFLIDYLEDQLSALKKVQFRLHLLMCKECGEYLRKYDSSVSLAQHYLEDPPPPELVELTLRFLDERASPRERGVEPGAEPCHP